MFRISKSHVLIFVFGFVTGCYFCFSGIIYFKSYAEVIPARTCKNVPIQCNEVSFNEIGESLSICDYLNLECPNYRHLLGIRAKDTEVNEKGMFGMGHADVLFLDYVFAAHPELVNITELGTASGKGGSIHTFDVEDLRIQQIADNWEENMIFFQEDIISEDNSLVIESLQRSPQIALFDNGKKGIEVNVYARYLPLGSVLLVHDWNKEIVWGEVEYELNRLKFNAIHENLAVLLGSNLRAFFHSGK